MSQTNNILIHLLSEDSILTCDLSIYKDREFVGKMSSGNVIEFPIEKDCELLFAFGRWNNKVKIRKGIDTHVYLCFKGTFGGLKVYTSNNENADEVFQQIDRDSSNTRLYVILIIVFIIALYLLMNYAD